MDTTEGKKVLLIDDNLSLTTLLGRALKKHGYDAYSENNAEKAIDSIREIKPDLIVLDLMMPGKSGVEVYSEIKLDTYVSKTPVVILSGLADDLKKDAFDCDVMSKPVKLEDLNEAIKKNLGLESNNEVDQGKGAAA